MPDQRAPYGRHDRRHASLTTSGDGQDGALQPYQGPTYYGLPAVKPSHYNFLIINYLFIGGLAGSAQVLATIADLTDRRSRAIVRSGRYLGLAGALASPVFLIGDLHYRRRWYNMLRIFRSTSPMSIGSWTLTVFGTTSGLTAACQLWEDLTGSRSARWLGRAFSLPAGLAGAMMSIYTGTLLAATSTPLWAAVYRHLPALFGASAASTAAAALTLSLEATEAPEADHRRVERFALVAGAAELTLTAATEHRWAQHGVADAIREEPASSAYHLGAIGLGIVVPLAIHTFQVVTGRRSRTASTLAAISALVGGYCLRAVVLKAGNRSARRPQDYFQLTQPQEVPALTGADGTGGPRR